MWRRRCANALRVALRGGAGNAGTVVKIERGAALVMTHSGTPDQPDIRTCRPSDLVRRLQTTASLQATAQDITNGPIAKNDTVKIVDGPLKNRASPPQHARLSPRLCPPRGGGAAGARTAPAPAPVSGGRR